MEELGDEFSRAIYSGLSGAPKCYRHMYVNGSHYQTILYDATLPKTRDCVVTATFAQQSVASTMDPNPVGDELCYVGCITDIISPRYGHLVDINMCRGQWYRPVVEENTAMEIRSTQHNAIRPRDESGFKVINTGALVPTYKEPFIMADQVAQAIIVPIEGEGGLVPCFACRVKFFICK